MKNTLTILLLVLLAGASSYAAAQAPAPSPANRATGTVTQIDAAAKQIKVKSDSGEDVSVALQDRTNYMRVGADLKNPTKIALGDIAIGDRVVARGALSEDKKSLTASSVVVMAKEELAKKHEAEHAEWRKRGVSGVITALNPDTRQITISVRGHDGVKPLIIPAAGSVDMRRYAPDSVRFSDAKPSTFADLKVGDQVRALGNKNEDGTELTPEYIVSGSFRNIAATVISVDPAAKTIRVTDLDTKRPELVRIEADSTLRKLTPDIANMLARRLKGPDAGGADAPRPAAMAGGRPGGGPGGPGGPGGGGGGMDLEQMIEKMPPLNLTDLKPGDALVISSTAGAQADKITAITLLAGVEPILTSAPKGRQGMALGSWNLGMGGADQ